MKVVISGGTGLIGRALTASLLKDGHEVVILSRGGNSGSKAPAGAKVVIWDGRSVGDWAQEVDGSDAVVNLAGSNLAGDSPLNMRWTKPRKAAILNSRVDAGRVLTEAVQKATKRPSVFVQSSAIGIYGPRGDEAIDESADGASDFLADVCRQWEASSVEVESLGVRRVIIRTAGIVLDNGNFAFFMFKLPVALFIGSPLGSGRQVISWIHIQDQVKAIRFLMETPTTQGVYNLTAPQAETNRDFTKMLARVMRRPFIPLSVPGFMLRLPLGEVSSVVLSGQRVIPERLQRTGFEFKFPALEPALRDLLKK